METKKTITLNNGVVMPLVGYGVYQVNPEECERCVSDALSVGYRAIDTAQAYFNEEGVGRGGDEEAMMPDYDFVEMLEHGMPPTCGFGLSERVFSFL